MTEQIQIRQMQTADRTRVLQIYDDAIRNDDATYLTKVPSWEEWNKNYDSVCRLVASTDSQVVGYAAVHPAERCIGEISIYIDRSYRRIGIGSSLLYALEKVAFQRQYQVLISKIFIENMPSICLHQKAGFIKKNTIRHALEKHNRWRDIYVYEKRA